MHVLPLVIIKPNHLCDLLCSELLGIEPSTSVLAMTVNSTTKITATMVTILMRCDTHVI